MAIFKKRLTIGLIETITLENGKTYRAKVDTGADSSSIDKAIFEKLENQKIASHKVIKSALGKHRRPTTYLEVEFQGKQFREKFTISDRSHMTYKVLIGKDILKKEGFLVDPNK